MRATEKQLKIIKFIEDILDVRYEGESLQEAYDFIGKYKKQAESNYRNYNYEGATIIDKSSFIRTGFPDYRNILKDIEFGENNDPFDWGVPNH